MAKRVFDEPCAYLLACWFIRKLSSKGGALNFFIFIFSVSELDDSHINPVSIEGNFLPSSFDLWVTTKDITLVYIELEFYVRVISIIHNPIIEKRVLSYRDFYSAHTLLLEASDFKFRHVLFRTWKLPVKAFSIFFRTWNLPCIS